MSQSLELNKPHLIISTGTAAPNNLGDSRRTTEVTIQRTQELADRLSRIVGPNGVEISLHPTLLLNSEAFAAAMLGSNLPITSLDVPNLVTLPSRAVETLKSGWRFLSDHGDLDKLKGEIREHGGWFLINEPTEQLLANAIQTGLVKLEKPRVVRSNVETFNTRPRETQLIVSQLKAGDVLVIEISEDIAFPDYLVLLNQIENYVKPKGISVGIDFDMAHTKASLAKHHTGLTMFGALQTIFENPELARKYYMTTVDTDNGGSHASLNNDRRAILQVAAFIRRAQQREQLTQSVKVLLEISPIFYDQIPEMMPLISSMVRILSE